MNVKRVNRMVCMLLDEMKDLTDEGRDLPVRWNIMHMFSSSQVAKLLALRRGMDMELAAVAAALHDIAVVMTKKSEKHAENAEKHVRDAIHRFNNGPWTKVPKITEEEEALIVTAISYHSEKEIYTEDPFIELLKDIDAIDRYLHGVKTEGAYLDRCMNVFAELGIDPAKTGG